MDKFTFCFLNSIYTDKDSYFYELIFSDRYFTTIGIDIVDSIGLQNILQNNLKFDFSIENGLLKSFEVDTYPITDYIRKFATKDMVIYRNPSDNLYSLIDSGIKEDYLFVSSKCDGVKVPFSSIKFSKSTMSVYAQVITPDNKIFNELIVSMENDVLVFYPFKFQSTTELSYDWCNLIDSSQDYFTYKVDVLSIYNYDSFISLPLINKTATLSNRLSTIISFIKDFQEGLVASLGMESETLEWIGGNSNKKGKGLYFHASNTIASSNDRNKAMEFILNYLEINNSYDGIIAAIDNTYFTIDLKLAMKTLSKELSNSSNLSDSFSIIKSMLSFYNKYKVYTDMYLYSIRSYAYFQKTSIVPKITSDGKLRMPIATGGGEKTYTTIKEVY